MEKELNFKRELLAKEYGSNIQNLVIYLLTIEDKAKRTEKAQLLKKLIIKMNPALKFAEDMDQKIWSAMYYLSDMKLDIDVEFEKPNIEDLLKKPEKVPYNKIRPRFKHYGRNVELIMDKIVAEKDAEKQQQGVVGIGKLMKAFYRNWNKDHMDNSLIATQIAQLSDRKIKVPQELLDDETAFDSAKYYSNNNSKKSNQGGNNRNNNNRNRNRNRNNRK